MVHPFRNIGEGIRNLIALAGTSVFNSSTKPENNFQANSLALKLEISCLVGSDTHIIDRIGEFVTFFPVWDRDTEDLIKAVKGSKVVPARYSFKDRSNRSII